MTSDPLLVLVRNMRARRKSLRITQEVAGDRAHMSTSYWSRLERGKIDPGVRTLTRIAAALETTAARLLADPNQRPSLKKITTTTWEPDDCEVPFDRSLDP
jgi:transcriptional regulator with XRE-family HTH domain